MIRLSAMSLAFTVVMMVKLSTLPPSGLRRTSHNPAMAKGSS